MSKSAYLRLSLVHGTATQESCSMLLAPTVWLHQYPMAPDLCQQLCRCSYIQEFTNICQSTCINVSINECSVMFDPCSGLCPHCHCPSTVCLVHGTIYISTITVLMHTYTHYCEYTHTMALSKMYRIIWIMCACWHLDTGILVLFVVYKKALTCVKPSIAITIIIITIVLHTSTQ